MTHDETTEQQQEFRKAIDAPPDRYSFKINDGNCMVLFEMVMKERYDAAIRQRDAAVRYLAEELGDYFSDNEVDDAIGKRLGIPANEVRRILEVGDGIG